MFHKFWFIESSFAPRILTATSGTLAESLGNKTQHTAVAVLSASSRLQQQAPNFSMAIIG